MTSRDFDFLTLRNLYAYQKNGSRVPNNYILSVSSNGVGIFTNTINPSTINTNYINVSTLCANIIDVDILSTNGHYTSSIVADYITANYYIQTPSTFSDYISSNIITAGIINIENNNSNGYSYIRIKNDGDAPSATEVSMNISTIAKYGIYASHPNGGPDGLIGSTFQIYSYYPINNPINVLTIYPNGNMDIPGGFSSNTISTSVITLIDNSGTIQLSTDGTELLVGGFPVITEGNISSLSSLYWEDTQGTGSLTGAIFNKNNGQGPQKYMVGIGTGSTLNGTLSVLYDGEDTTGNSFHISSNNNQLFVENNNEGVGINGLSLQLKQNQATTFGPSLHFYKSYNFNSSLDTGELGYISFYGTNDFQNSARGGYIMARQNGIPSTFTPTDLQFITNTSSSENINMVITSEGNVGIGTITPSEKLTVNGNINLISSSDDNAYLSLFNNKALIKTNIVYDGIYLEASGNKPIHLTNIDDINRFASFGPDDNILNLNTICQSSLTVQSNIILNGESSDGYGALKISGGPSENSIFIKDGINVNPLNANNGYFIGNSDGFGGPSTFQIGRIDNGNDIPLKGIYLTQSGNVGIGNTNPQYILDIAGTTNISGGDLRISSNTNESYVLIDTEGNNQETSRITLKTSNRTYSLYSVNQNGGPDGETPGAFQIYSYDTNYSNANKIFIMDSNGNTTINGNLEILNSTITCNGSLGQSRVYDELYNPPPSASNISFIPLVTNMNGPIVYNQESNIAAGNYQLQLYGVAVSYSNSSDVISIGTTIGEVGPEAFNPPFSQASINAASLSINNNQGILGLNSGIFQHSGGNIRIAISANTWTASSWSLQLVKFN